MDAKKITAEIRNAENLDSLYALIMGAETALRELEISATSPTRANFREDAEILRAAMEAALSDLPTWGPEPQTGTTGVYSWDTTRVLVAGDSLDWELVDREEWAEWADRA